jgi:30S ribosomal protein S31
MMIERLFPVSRNSTGAASRTVRQNASSISGRNGIMGKGDKRSKRGKLFKGTFGKRRVKPQKAAKKIRDSTAAGA